MTDSPMTGSTFQRADLPALMRLFAPDQVADPYPAYREWRVHQPIARPHERLFVLSRFADCEAVLASTSFGHVRPGDIRPFGRRVREANIGSFLTMNPPDHTRLRRLVSRAFTPARVKALTPRVETITEELLDGLSGQDGPFDLVEGVAQPLPVRVICELLGVMPDDYDLLVGWSAALSRGLDPGFLLTDEDRVRQRHARDAFASYLAGLLPVRRQFPGDDLLSALVRVHDEGDALSESELISTVTLLLVAGHETTRSLIGGGALALLRHPGQLAVLREHPELTGQAVEEMLRYDPSVQLVVRYALRDAQVGGTAIPAGSSILLLLGAANRDETVFPDPDRFEVGRDAHRHLAFGHGIHFCLGAPLARLEATVALRCLLPLLSRSRIAAEPVWKPNTVLRGLEHLSLMNGVKGRCCGTAGPARLDPSTRLG
jgi:cytochrome P450